MILEERAREVANAILSTHGTAFRPETYEQIFKAIMLVSEEHAKEAVLRFAQAVKEEMVIKSQSIIIDAGKRASRDVLRGRELEIPVAVAGRAKTYNRWDSKHSDKGRCKAWSHALAGQCDLMEGHEGLHDSAGDGFHQEVLIPNHKSKNPPSGG